MEISKEKQIDIDIAVEEMASAVRERTVACNKCEYYKEGSCLKPIDLGCNDNEDILNLCDAIYEKGYRKVDDIFEDIFEGRLEVVNKKSGDKLKKASDVAKEVCAEIGKRFKSLLGMLPAEGALTDAKTFIDAHWEFIEHSIVFAYDAELKKKYIGKDTNVTTNTED